MLNLDLNLQIFTQEVFINRNNRYHIGWAIFQWAGFLWAVYAGMSRITDNKHHLQDVAAGFFIGSTTSYWVVSYIDSANSNWVVSYIDSTSSYWVVSYIDSTTSY